MSASSNSASIPAIILDPTHKTPPSDRYAEGTGTGCSACAYDPETGTFTLAYTASNPVPARFDPMFLVGADRYVPPATALADLVSTDKAVWRLPDGVRPAMVLLEYSYQEAKGVMAFARRVFGASQRPPEDLDNAAE